MRIIITLMFSFMLLACISVNSFSSISEKDYTNKTGKPLIVLSAPSINDEYYREVFAGIITYDIEFANKVMGKDNVVVIAGKDTMPQLKGRLPDDILLEADVHDIWIRDFSPAIFGKQVKFKYLPEYLTKTDARDVENSFNDLLQSIGVYLRNKSNLIIDGGNIVENGNNMAVVTERVFSDNAMISKEKLFVSLKEALDVEHLAIIPEEAGDTTGHSDGMVSFIGEKTLLVNTYEEPFRTRVLSELKNSLPGVNIIEVPGKADDGEWEGFASACGLNLNSIVTDKYIYVPVFGKSTDAEVLDIMKKNTSREIVTMDAKNVCRMGGSVRCLSWQIKGEQADRIVKAARE